MKQIRARLTYANVMSTIAVFLVLGGATAIAAGQLGRNSVGSKQLKRSAVTATKIRNNAVTTAKIRNGAISGAKLDLTTIGQVPAAAAAINATNAGNARTVANQAPTKIFQKLAAGAATTTIASFGGFTLTASCPNVVGKRVLITLTAPPAVPAVLTALTSGDGEGDVVHEYEAGANVSIQLANESSGESTFSAATTDGAVVSGGLGFDYPPTFAGEEVCAVYGEVLAG